MVDVIGNVPVICPKGAIFHLDTEILLQIH